MKKTFFFLAAALIYFFLTLSVVQAQGGSSNFGMIAFDVHENADRTGIINKHSVSADISSGLMRSFLRAYPNATDAEWLPLADKSSACNFFVNGILNKAYYDRKGNWLYTITSYEEDHLQQEVRHIVRSNYYDYAITYVNEINFANGNKVHIVQIQDDKNIIILRIADNEMEVINELEKI